MIGPQILGGGLGEWDSEKAYSLEGPGGQKTLVFCGCRFLLFTVELNFNAFREDTLKGFWDEVGKDKQ